MVASAEFGQDYAGLDVGDFVNRLYATVLHRAAEATGSSTGPISSTQARPSGHLLLSFSDD